MAVSDARQAAAASGVVHVDQEEEVEDETILHEFQNKTFVPWLQGLSVTELDDLGEARGTTLAYELEKVPMSKFGNDQDRIRDELKQTSSMAFGHRNILCQVCNTAQAFCEVQDSRLFFELY